MMYLVLKGVMEHMKISALFNNNKTAHQLREIWKYASLVGINNQEIEVPLENDIGVSGEIYEGGKVRVWIRRARVRGTWQCVRPAGRRKSH